MSANGRRSILPYRYKGETDAIGNTLYVYLALAKDRSSRFSGTSSETIGIDFKLDRPSREQAVINQDTNFVTIESDSASRDLRYITYLIQS